MTTVKKKALSKKRAPAKPKLTAKQSLFVKEYLVDINATQAAIRAGYSNKTAQRIGSENLSKPLIAEAISNAKDKRANKTGVDAEFILTSLADMAKADPCDIFDENGAFKPIQRWPLVWRRMLSAVDVKEIMEYQGPKRCNVKIGELVKFKFPDRLRVFEVLGKHVDVQAFIKKIEVADSSVLVDRLMRARERSQGKYGGFV